MKRPSRSTVAVLLVFAALLTGWIVMGDVMYRRVVPPPSVADLSSFLTWHGRTPDHMYLVRTSNGEYLHATGSNARPNPSGPSVYVFDRSGRLVDWTSDMGDDGRFQKEWQAATGAAWSGPRLDAKQAVGWVKASSPAAVP